MSAFLRPALGDIRLITQGEAFLSCLALLGAMLRSGQASLHPLGRLSFTPGEDREVAIIQLRLAVLTGFTGQASSFTFVSSVPKVLQWGAMDA